MTGRMAECCVRRGVESCPRLVLRRRRLFRSFLLSLNSGSGSLAQVVGIAKQAMIGQQGQRPTVRRMARARPQVAHSLTSGGSPSSRCSLRHSLSGSTAKGFDEQARRWPTGMDQPDASLELCLERDHIAPWRW